MLLLITIYQAPKRGLRIWQTPATLLVVNLSICDLVAGLVPGYGLVFYNVCVLRGQMQESLVGVQLLVFYAGIGTDIVSSGTLVALSFDRFFAVLSPLQYKAQLTKTKRRVKVVIALIWIYSLTFPSLPLMEVPISLFFILNCHLHISVPILVLPVVYWKTFRALRVHNNQVKEGGKTENGRGPQEQRTQSDIHISHSSRFVLWMFGPTIHH